MWTQTDCQVDHVLQQQQHTLNGEKVFVLGCLSDFEMTLAVSRQ